MSESHIENPKVTAGLASYAGARQSGREEWLLRVACPPQRIRAKAALAVLRPRWLLQEPAWNHFKSCPGGPQEGRKDSRRQEPMWSKHEKPERTGQPVGNTSPTSQGMQPHVPRGCLQRTQEESH